MAKLYGLMRLGKDAEIRKAGDNSVCNLSLAYNYGKKEGDSRPTQWIDAALWGKRADTLAQYLKKGTSHLFTISDVHIETYTDKDGYEAFKLSGTVDDVELGSSGDRNNSSSSSSGAAPQRRPAQGTQPSQSAPRFSDDMDDDIPF